MKKNSSILIDKEIIELVQLHHFIAPFDEKLLSGCSYDIRAGSTLISRNRTAEFDLSKEPYVIESGECVTISSMEEFSLRDSHLFGVIANKHSVLAHGLFHPITTVDPGFKGRLSITFIHMGHVPYKIAAGDKMSTIYFQQLSDVPDRIYGVTQTPSVKEGSTDYALIIKKPEERSGKDSSFMYPKPYSELSKKIEELEKKLEKIDGQAELTYYRKTEEKKKEKLATRRWFLPLSIAIASFIVGGVLFGGFALLKRETTPLQTKPSQYIDSSQTRKDSIKK